jgi:hypothetical protein
MPETPFEPKDVHAVYRASIDAEHQSKEREERMPSSAEAFRRHAADLRIVLEKLLERLPDQRKNYP